MIAVIDYGMGNIHSVVKAIQTLGQDCNVACTKQDLQKADKLVLPGVGAFADAMQELGQRGLSDAVCAEVRNKKPFLGICLGMQLLFEKSEEAPGTMGLGVLRGAVKRFQPQKGLKVPHIGWNRLHQVTSECPLLKDVPDNSYVYFCHSYYVQPQEENIIAASTDYGLDFTSVVYQDNIAGIQFHPEKSQKIGLKILENFLSL